MKKIVFVVAEDNFRDEELFFPKEVLESKGFECVVASKKRGTCVGMLGKRAEATLSLKEVWTNFDAIVFVGGGGAAQYFSDVDALWLAVKYFDLGKIVAAICIAPSILANAGILEGKKATAFSSEKENLQNKGAAFTGKHVEIDGRIITASGPQAARSFGEEIAKKLQ